MNCDARNKTKFTPVVVLKNGILQIDGHMAYTNGRGKWLYVSEDGQTVIMYNNVSDMVRDMYKRDDDSDYIIAGWDTLPIRFSDDYDKMYDYYNARYID